MISHFKVGRVYALRGDYKASMPSLAKALAIAQARARRWPSSLQARRELHFIAQQHEKAVVAGKSTPANRVIRSAPKHK